MRYWLFAILIVTSCKNANSDSNLNRSPLGTQTFKSMPQEKPEKYYLFSNDGYIQFKPGVWDRDNFLSFLVPKYAVEIEKTENEIVLKFQEGWTAKFSFEGGYLSNGNFYYGYSEIFDEVKRKQKFYLIMESEGIHDKYLQTNPYYQHELTVFQRIQSNPPKVNIESVLPQELEPFFSDKDGILLIPDYHGNEHRFEFLKSLIRDKRVSFVALEMLEHIYQESLRDFLKANMSSKDYSQARKVLIEYYSKAWTSKFEDQRTGQSNPYFQIWEMVRNEQKQGYAIDVMGSYYEMRSQNDPLPVGTRNLVWAEAIPPKGRGVLFGGMAHFSNPLAINVQDFVAKRGRLGHIYMVNFGDRDKTKVGSDPAYYSLP